MRAMGLFHVHNQLERMSHCDKNMPPLCMFIGPIETMSTKRQQAIKSTSITAIASLWVAASYLLIYYVGLFYFGPDRLHALLGDKLYNALIAGGGFPLLVFIIVIGILWVIPFAFASMLTAGILRLAFPRQGQRLPVAALIGLILTASLPFVLFDGWPSTLWPLVIGDDTEFAPQYSAWSFFQIRAGMTESEVERAIGQPLEIWPYEADFIRCTSKTQITNTHGKTYGWHYTRSPSHSSYRRRIVAVKDGRVVGKGAYLYLD